MTKIDENIQTAQNMLSWMVERCYELEEENKNLNKEIENHKQNIMQDELEIIPKLEEENKKLKSDLAFERTMLDNVRAEYESSQAVIKKLKETIKDHQLYEEKLEHRIIEFEELLHWE